MYSAALGEMFCICLVDPFALFPFFLLVRRTSGGGELWDQFVEYGSR